ncbi:MAG: hypothetical protein NC319_06670, partial [Butyricicoccus sp.]|nr:hypothetical protein [Butyricicoccus sp.]
HLYLAGDSSYQLSHGLVEYPVWLGLGMYSYMDAFPKREMESKDENFKQDNEGIGYLIIDCDIVELLSAFFDSPYHCGYLYSFYIAPY